MLRALKLLLLPLFAVVLVEAAEPGGRYLDVDEYLASAFPEDRPPARVLWVASDLRESVEQLLGHRFTSLRVRYWYDGATSAWVLDEVGKELPITIGVTIRDDTIVSLRVLEFRESRGWEVRYPFFTDQFRNVRLQEDGHLDHKIDGITGATLSVGAVKRVARLALLFHDYIKQTG